jgi:hypothetical protein
MKQAQEIHPKKSKEQRTCVRCSRLVPSPRYFAKTDLSYCNGETLVAQLFAAMLALE